MPAEAHSWQNLEELKELAGLPSSISFPSQTQSYTEACAIKPDPEDCKSVSSDLDSQATEVYEPVLGPTTPAQFVRAAGYRTLVARTSTCCKFTWCCMSPLRKGC